MTERSIRATANLPRQPHGEGFAVAFLHPEAVDGGFDPFLQIDAFALAQPVFKPHPHAGFSAVTYILPESPIGFINRDSLGNRQRIAPGALHWTAAGSGILHEEVPERQGVAALGLQMFIDLPLGQKEAPARFLHQDAGEVPVVQGEGVVIRVVVGQSQDATSPLDSPTPGVRLIDVTLAPGARFTQALAPGENSLIYMIGGNGLAGRDAQPLVVDDLAASRHDGDSLGLIAGADGARFVLFGGLPLAQPIVSRGPFVTATDEQMRRAIEAYNSGRMGRLAPNSYDAAGAPIL